MSRPTQRSGRNGRRCWRGFIEAGLLHRRRGYGNAFILAVTLRSALLFTTNGTGKKSVCLD